MPVSPSFLSEQFLLPPPAWQAVIQDAVLLTVAPGAAPVVRTLLPTFQVVLLVNLGPPADLWPAQEPAARHRLVGTALLGPVKTAWRYQLAAGARVLAVNFTLAGFFRLFQVPLDQLAAGLTDPSDLRGAPRFADLRQRLLPLRQPADLLRQVVAGCRPYLRPADPAQAVLLTHLPLLMHRPELNPLQVLATASQRSERLVQLWFRKYLGFSAREAARFARFRQVVAAVQRGSPTRRPDWSALLEHYGYHDQPHLIHDFTHFLHQPPGQVARQLWRGDAVCATRSELLQTSAAAGGQWSAG